MANEKLTKNSQIRYQRLIKPMTEKYKVFRIFQSSRKFQIIRDVNFHQKIKGSIRNTCSKIQK